MTGDREAAQARRDAPRPLIRPAVEADVPALVSLIAELGYTVTAEDLAGNLVAVAASPTDELLVAECDGTAVGLLLLRVVVVIHRTGLVGEYNSLVVSEAYRRRGIGRALLAAGENWLRAKGATSVRVSSSDRRKEEAHRFYMALGYEPTHTTFRKGL